MNESRRAKVLIASGVVLLIVSAVVSVAAWTRGDGNLGTMLSLVTVLAVCGLLSLLAGARISRARTCKTIRIELDGHESYYARTITELTFAEENWLSRRHVAALSHCVMAARLAKRLIRADIIRLEKALRVTTQTGTAGEANPEFTIVHKRGGRRRERGVSIDDLVTKKNTYQQLRDNISHLLQCCEQALRPLLQEHSWARRARERERARARAREQKRRAMKEWSKQLEEPRPHTVEANHSQAGARAIPTNVRQAVLDRDDFICRYCGRRSQTMEIDHVVPVSHGGASDDTSNLVTACLNCNRKKGGRTPEEAEMEVLPVRTRNRDRR